jgi:phosphopantothenoylcysteine decarboxylase/phosphopantothenate--cysteine ligase
MKPPITAITLGISGHCRIKSVFLCRLSDAGAMFTVTLNGARFITLLVERSRRDVLSTCSRRPLRRHTSHRHRHRAELAYCPGHRQPTGRYANGLDDLLTTLDSTTSPVMLAPAMNTEMWYNAAVQENLQKLRNRGVLFVEPGVGELACHTVGVGRMAERKRYLNR